MYTPLRLPGLHVFTCLRLCLREAEQLLVEAQQRAEARQAPPPAGAAAAEQAARVRSPPALALQHAGCAADWRRGCLCLHRDVVESDLCAPGRPASQPTQRGDAIVQLLLIDRGRWGQVKEGGYGRR